MHLFAVNTVQYAQIIYYSFAQFLLYCKFNNLALSAIHFQALCKKIIPSLHVKKQGMSELHNAMLERVVE